MQKVNGIIIHFDLRPVSSAVPAFAMKGQRNAFTSASPKLWVFTCWDDDLANVAHEGQLALIGKSQICSRMGHEEEDGAELSQDYELRLRT